MERICWTRTKKSGDAGARGIVEMVQGEVEKKSRKLLRKWSLCPIRSDLWQRTRADGEDKPGPVEMKHARREEAEWQRD